jgi:hypothetical protein
VIKPGLGSQVKTGLREDRADDDSGPPKEPSASRRFQTMHAARRYIFASRQYRSFEAKINDSRQNKKFAGA